MGTKTGFSFRRFLCGISLGVLFACGVSAWAGQGSPDRLVVGVSAIAPTLDPHMTVTATAMPTMFALFDALTTMDAQGRVQPALALSWKAVDETTWDFKLRSGVKFHNGEAFNAAAVKFTLDRLLGDLKAPVRIRVRSIKRVTVLADDAVRIETEAPDPLLLKALSVVFMLPPAFFKEAGSAGFAKAPVGTGALRFKEYVRDSHITLEAVPDSWRGRPKIREVTMRVLPEDAVRVAALRTGELDLARGIPPADVSSLKQAGFRIASTPVAKAALVTLNTHPERKFRVDALNDKRVRQALNYAVDKQAIIKNIFLGYAEELDGQPVGRDAFGHHPGLKAFPYDRHRARQLLQEAGLGGGFTVKMEFAKGMTLVDQELAEAIAGYLAEVGVKLELFQVERTLLSQHNNAGATQATLLTTLNYFPVLDADFLLGWFHSKALYRFTSYPTFDQLLDRSRRIVAPEQRVKVLQEIMAFAHEDPVAIYLFKPSDIYGMHAGVQGFTPRSDEVIWFDGLSKQ